MRNNNQIDLVRMAIYLLKRVWLIVLCAAIGFGVLYWRAVQNQTDTYTATGTWYVYNANPNVINYQQIYTSDLNSAVQLLDTYMVVIRSNKVMDVLVERLTPEYPGITSGLISGSLSMGSLSETGVLQVRCRTRNAQMSADICNAVLDVAPEEIIRVVSAGSVKVIDYATTPTRPDPHSTGRQAIRGGLYGGVAAAALLVLLFLLNRRVADVKDLTDSYTPPLLASVRRSKKENEDPSAFLLSDDSPMEVVESYAKMRMNLLYTLVGKEHRTVVITSSLPGEGKSTISANLAISCALGGKRVLLIDGDMRRACQKDIFRYRKNVAGLSDILVGSCGWRDAVRATDWEMLNVLPAGQLPPNPAELLGSAKMQELIAELEANYELVLMDMPPVNIVSDPLVLSSSVAGSLFVVRQNFSDHREVAKALRSAELTGMDILGFVFYGESLHEGGYYYYDRKYYRGYYHKYDTRKRSNHTNQKRSKKGEGDGNVE